MNYVNELRKHIGTGSVYFDAAFLSRNGGIARESKSMYSALLEQSILLTYRNQILNLSNQVETGINLSVANFKMATLNFKSYYPKLEHYPLVQSQISPIYNNFSEQTFIRLHDIFPITNPEWFPRKQIALFGNSFKGLSGAENFLCDSNYTYEKLLELYPHFAGSAKVIYCSTESHLNQTSCNSCFGCIDNLDFAYILAVGTIEPRKNYEFLINATENLKSAKILIVGQYGWKSRTVVQKLRSSKNIVWLNNICDFGLTKLYRRSRAFVSTSIDEGFNLPAFEARNLNVPLILSDIPVHRELHSQFASFYKNFNEADFKKTLRDFV